MQATTDPSIAVRLAGRTYPASVRNLNRMTPVIDVPGDNKHASGITNLVSDLWERLPFAEVSIDDFTQPKDLIRSYSESLTMLHSFCADVVGLVEAICEANIEIRQPEQQNETAAQTAFREKVAELVRGTTMPIKPPRNIMYAHLAEESLVQLHQRLTVALHSAVNDFVSQFFEGLSLMVDESLLGLVEWTGNNSCKYHFFRFVVLQEFKQQETTAELMRDNSTDIYGTAWARRIKTTKTWEDTHRLARHEHHALDTYVTTIANSTVVMPPNVQRLVDTIPDWLRSITRVVDGTLIRELVVEQDVRREQWNEVTSRDEPVYDLEPAVIINQFVLTGWGPREINLELNRRQQMEPQKQASSNWFWFIVGVITQVISFLLIQGANKPTLFVLMWIFFCCGIPCWVRWLETNSKRQQLSLSYGQPILFAVGMVLLSGGIHIAAVYVRLKLNTALVVTAIACLFTGVGLLFCPQVSSITQFALEDHR